MNINKPSSIERAIKELESGRVANKYIIRAENDDNYALYPSSMIKLAAISFKAREWSERVKFEKKASHKFLFFLFFFAGALPFQV